MTVQNKIFFLDTKKILFASVFCLFLSYEGFSQEERGKNIPDLNKGSDNVGQSENSDSFRRDNKAENFYTPNTQIAPKADKANPATTRKDQQLYKMGGEKDIKKEGMSTLSFNLFLYIVDKFKED